jgi:OmpA-OmpF porin, OOP family
MTIRSRSVMWLLAGSAVAVLSACGTTQDMEELQAARSVVAQVESSPQASLAAANVNEARNALDRANAAAEDGEDEKAKHLAYLATRHAQIANEKILTARAEEALRQGEADRQRVMAQARTREAQMARQSAAEAQANARSTQMRADELQSEAQRLALEREQLERELASLKDLNARRTERGLVLTLGDVLFDIDQATLKPGAMNTMDRLANFLKQGEGRSVVVEGHTDSTGSDSYNMELSRRRADAVRTALIERGVNGDQIQSTGKGEGVPVASNDNVGGRQQNRRVEIIIPEEGQSGRVAAEGEE